MRLLFIKLKHIGDALLLTPTLTAVKQAYPQAEVCVLVRKGTEGILAGCPSIDRILTSAAPEAARRSWGDLQRDVQQLRELRRQPPDWAFELSDGDRGRWMAWMSGARRVVATSVNVKSGWVARRLVSDWVDRDWTGGHRVEKDFQTVSAVLPLTSPIPPLSFQPEACRAWEAGGALESGSFVVLHPGTRWRRKRWPADRWLELGRRILGQGDRVVVSSGPDAEERQGASALVAALGAGAMSTDGQTSWAQLAWLLRRASAFVGVDTAAMHLAAACGCPTVAIFGPSVIHQWRPWQVNHRLLTSAVPVPSEDEPKGVVQVSVDEVFGALNELVVRV